MSCIKSLPLICRLGIARVGIRTLLLVLFTCVMQHTAVLLGNSSTLNKRGENPPRFRRTTPAALSLANPLPSAQTLFSFSAVMAFHEALTIKDWPMCIVQTICEELEENEFVPFPVSWTVKMKKKQKETQDSLSYHTQAAGCSDKARAKASGGRQPIEECGRTGL